MITRLDREDSAWCYGRYLDIPETSWLLLRISWYFSTIFKSVIETSIKERRRSSSSCAIARQYTHNCCSTAFQAAWFGGLRIATTSSSAGATARNSSSGPDRMWFPSVGAGEVQRQKTKRIALDEPTVALTRAIQHTYIVSPVDMAGLIGMAQTLAVYHYGYYTLKDRTVQFHEPKHVPSDAEAVLEWGLDTPFSSQDKPPLAIAMVVTVNGARSLKRFRLVIAQKSKLRLTQEVTAALASHSRDHRLTASSFFPCSIDREYLYGYAGDGYRSPLWLCASYNGYPVLVHRLRGSKMYFHQATKDRRILLIPGIHYFDAHRLQPLLLQAPALQVHMRESSLVGPEGAGEQVGRSLVGRRNKPPLQVKLRQKVKMMTRLHPQRSHGARQYHRPWMILRNRKSKVLQTSWPL